MLQDSKFLQLQQKIVECSRCELKANKVTNMGNAEAKVFLIGQAPGKEEIRQNKPFAGPSRRRLFSWFEKAGFDETSLRKILYMTALIHCYPGSNKKGGDLKPTPYQINACLENLKEEFLYFLPKLVILVGSLAQKVFLNKERLDETVGKLHKGNIFGHQVNIICLPHPSGRSLWYNKKENIKKLYQSIKIFQNEVSQTIKRKIN
jgi:uracil-DNA glycosylase